MRQLFMPFATSVLLFAMAAIQASGQDGGLQLVTNWAGATIVLSGAQGDSNYVWSKDGALLSDDGRVTGAQSATLTIGNAVVEDSGTYVLASVMSLARTNTQVLVVMTNAFPFTGCVRTNFTVVSIFQTNDTDLATIVQETNSVPAGDCALTNYVLYYQTNTITTTNMARTNAIFVLEVLPPPPVVYPPTIRTFRFYTGGDDVTFEVEADGTPPLSYQWTWQGQDIPGATSSTLVCNQAQASANAGYYGVRIWNEAGQAATPPPGILFTKPVAAGTYQGIFYDEDNPSVDTSGSFQYTLSASKRSFSGKVVIGKDAYRFSGAFSPAHDALVRTLPRPDGRALTLSLQLLATNGMAGVTGTLDNGSWSVPLRGNRAAFSSKNPAPQAGKYTFALQNTNLSGPSLVPNGNSFGSVVISKSGTLAMSGRAADGTALSHSCSLSKAGDWPLYMNLYKNRGCMMGWLSVASETGGSIGGESLCWLKNGFPDKLYPDGFLLSLQPIGSPFVTSTSSFAWPPPPVVNVIPFTEAVAAFAAGDLFSQDLAVWDFVKVTVPEANRFAAEKGPEQLALSVGRGTGTISGGFVDFVTGKRTPIRGVLLQQQNCALGYFLSGESSGYFSLDANSGPE